MADLPVIPPKENLQTVVDSNTVGGYVEGEETVPIDSLSGGISTSKRAQDTVKDIAARMSGRSGYIERLVVDQDGNVIEGAHRLEALRKIGVKEVPVTRIVDPTSDLDLVSMEKAIKGAGKIHPDHVNQVISQIGDMLRETGNDPGKVLTDYTFPKGYEKYFKAALTSLESEDPRPTDQSKLPAVIDAASVASQLARTQADDPRPKGLRRGLGSLKRAPWMALAQMTWENLTPKQREVAEQYGKEAYGSFEDAWKAASAWSERNRFPTGVEGGLQWVMDRLGFSEQPRPNTHEDLSLPELITGYAIAPAKRGSTRSNAVTREELVSRLRSDPELQKVSQKALKDLGYKGTIPLFRVTLTPEGGFKSEGVVSTSLTPESHLDTIKYFTKGKISPFHTITPRLIRYDVPIEKIIGYLPAFKDQIKRGVNKAVKAKGMGQQALKGFSKVGDPARHAKNLLDKQKEVLVDVTGISPTFMKVFDAQESKETFVNPLSIRMSRIEKIGRGQIKTPEDYRRDMGGNETYFDFKSAGELLRDLGKDRFRQLENEHMQKEIEHYKKFFGGAGDAQKNRALTPAQLDDFFENMGEDGVGMEYPELYEALERYTYGVDSTGLVDAFNDPRYPEYKEVLQINLRRIFPEGKIPVQRVEGYIGQYTEDHDGKRTFLERPKRTRTRFEISPEDVIFSGLEGESELIIDGKKYGYDRDFLSVSIKPMDPERKASGGFVDKPLYQDARMIG